MQVLKMRALALLLSLTLLAGFSLHSAKVASAHSLIANTQCLQYMRTEDDSNGNPFAEHTRFVKVDSNIDLTNLYNQGQAVITYTSPDDSDNETFDNKSWMQAQTVNTWGVSTRWAWFHSDWASGTWIIWWTC